MAETLIQERYQFDFDPGGAISELDKLARRLDVLRGSISAAKESGASFEKQQAELTATEQKFLSILNQEVNTYDGINAKRRILAATLGNMTKGTAAYSARLKEVQELQRRELNTTEGLNARRKELRAETEKLEKGTREYARAMRELTALESRAAKGAAETAKASGGFATALRGGLASIGVVFGIQEALRLGREALTASAEKQQQKNALLVALDNQVEVQERLLAQADDLEARTLVDDDDIIALDRYLASLGFTEKQIRLMNEASVQLAAVTGKSVRGATDLLIAAQSGQVRGLAKLIPEVKRLSKEQLAAGVATDLVAKKFAGSAEALTTGIVGAQNKLKDLSEGFKEGLGDAITEGLAKNFAVFSKLSSEGAETFFSRILAAAKKTITDIVALPATAIAGIKAIIAGAEAAFDFVGNRIDILFLETEQKYLAAKRLLRLSDEEDLNRLQEISSRILEAQIRNAGGFATNVSIAARTAYDEALEGFEDFSKALKKEGEDADRQPFLPNVPKKAKIVKDSLQDLENQLSKLRETVNNSVVATDKAALEPILLEIQRLEKRIEAAKKLQESLIPKQVEIEFLATANVQGEFLKAEIEKAKIEEQAIRQNAAVRLRAIQEAQNLELQAAGTTAEQKTAIEERYQLERERLAIDTDRRIATNALQQKSLELAELERTSKPGQNLEGIAKLKADIAELQAQLAVLQGKSIEIDVNIPPSAKDKLKADIEEIANSIVDLAQNIIGAIDSVFAAQQARADKAVDFQKSKLDEALANSEDFTAEQIRLERDRLDKLQKQQEQAAQRAKAAQIAQVIANTVIAVAKAAGQTGVAAPIAIISTLAAIAAGIGSAVALSQNAFYEGTDYVQLGKNPKGKDTVPAMLHEGEAVLQSDVNKAYHPTVKAMRRWGIAPEVLNDFVESARGGSQFVPRGRSHLPSSQEGMVFGVGSGAGANNFYFQAKLGKLEQESETQTEILKSIAANTKQQITRTRIAAPKSRPHRFV